MWERTELVYASTYLFVALAPFAAVDAQRTSAASWCAGGRRRLSSCSCGSCCRSRRRRGPSSRRGRSARSSRWNAASTRRPARSRRSTSCGRFSRRRSGPGGLGRAGALAWAWAARSPLSCVTTGMHTVADVAAGLAAALLVLRLPAVWEALRARRRTPRELVARMGLRRGARHQPRRLGRARDVRRRRPRRVLSPGSAAVRAVLLVAFAGLAGAGLWAQFVEGSPRLLGPTGTTAASSASSSGACAARAAFGADAWLLLGAFAVAAPWIQAAGRVRCLVQGCCHGAPAPPERRDPLPARALARLPALGARGVPLHPTPLYSILWNVVPGAARRAALGRARAAARDRRRVPDPHGARPLRRGVPARRAADAGLRAPAPLPVDRRGHARGRAPSVTCLPATVPTPAPEPSWPRSRPAAAFAAATWFALGVDFPRSNRRFARLV